MGGLITLCMPDGGPCGGNIDSRNRATRRQTSPIEEERLLKNDESTSDSSNTTNSDSKSVQAIQHKRPSLDSSIFTVPTKKIPISSIIAKHILRNDHFVSIRKQMEANALRLYEINRIVFQNDCWLIQGSDSIALDDHRNLFDIIIWRVPIIPAFAHFYSAKQLYAKLFDKKQKPPLNTEGIWSVLPKEKFIEMFDAKLLEQIDIINDPKHSYLADAHSFAPNSEEYKDLIDKLARIEVMKKANEIIIIGQKICVIDLLRVIRKEEVKHASMAGMFKTKSSSFEWEIKCDDANAPDPKFIRSYYCVVGNIGLQCTEEDLHELLAAYPRWLYAKIIMNDDDEESGNDDGSDDQKDVQVDGHVIVPRFDATLSLKLKIPLRAKIEFDTNEALQTFIDDVEGSVGLYLDGTKLFVEQKDKELKQRKTRRLYPGHMIV